MRSNTRRIDLPPFGPSAGGDSTPTTPGSGSDADGNLLAPNAASGAAPERSLTRVLSDSSLNGGGERTRRESLTGGSSRRNLHPLAPSLSQTRLGLSVRTSAEENRGRDNQPGSAKSGDGDTPKAIASHMMWQPNGVRSTHFKVKYVPSISK